MITLKQLAEYLQEQLSCSDYQDVCPNGIQVEGSQEVSSIATAVTATIPVIEEAVNLGIDALIVHHGLFWRGDDYQIVGVKKRKLQLLIQHNISLIAYHLPLDAHRDFGNNWLAAKQQGWCDLQPFGEFNGSYIGVKGRVTPQKREEFQALLEKYYDHPAHAAEGGKEVIETVALVSGGAYKSIGEAASEGVDCFVTGNYDLPAWDDAFERGINFYAMGHCATERIGPRALGEHLEKQFALKNRFIDQYNPF